MDTSPGLILVVDDEAVSLKILASLLSKTAYQSVFLNRGEDIVKICCLRKPELILLDLVMGGIDGFEVCRRLKAEAACADSGYAAYLAQQPDVSVCDIALPQAGGLELLRKIRQRDSAAAVVMCSMYDSAALVRSRSEERRVGKECFVPCRSRWSPYH